MRKAPGGDDIETEVWKNASTELKMGLLDLYNKVWKEGEIPGDLMEAVIILIYKNKERNTLRTIEGSLYYVLHIKYLQRY